MSYCEDYPCCGHTPDDPCERQPYDEPGYYDTSVPGNEHALCNHEEGECNVEYYDDDLDDVGVLVVWHDEAQRFADTGKLDPIDRCLCGRPTCDHTRL